MSRLYDDWKKTVSHKLPKVFKKSSASLSEEKPPVCIAIPLKGGIEPTELDDNFRKVIEREYAVRYLEIMGVEPTKKQIKKIKKEMPLESCEIRGVWQTSGWLADVMYIYPRGKPSDNKPISRQLTARLETQQAPTTTLPREESYLTLQHLRNQESNQAYDIDPDERIQINLDLDHIKRNYLLPFMKVASDVVLGAKAQNIALMKEKSWERAERQRILQYTSDDLMQSKVFKFPFDEVTVATAHIKELMNPINTSVEDVARSLRYTIKNFPIRALFHDRPQDPKRFTFKKALKSMDTEDNARLIGLISHFCYWTVFGHIHSIGINVDARQQIFITILHLFHKEEDKNYSQKHLDTALNILLIRMIVENIFQNSYKLFFSIPNQHRISAEKIQSVITKLLDPECLYSRFSFLEAGLDAVNLAGKMRGKMSSKFYSTSSVVKSLFPRPQDPKTRLMLAKKEAYDGKLDCLVKTAAQIDGTMPLQPGKMNYYQQTEPWKQNDYLDIPTRAQLYKIAIEKVNKTKTS